MVKVDVIDGQSELRSKSQAECYLCHQAGIVLHHHLKDRLYEVTGEWSFRRCSNPECGLVWIDPVLIEEDIGQAYSSYFTHGGGLDSFGYQLRQRFKRGFAGLAYGYKAKTSFSERLLAIPVYLMPFLKEQVIASGFMHLRGERLGKLLEIGCGNGSLLSNLRDLGWEVEGLDFDPAAVESARSNWGLNVQLGSLESQYYADNQFDAIVMSHVIEHLHDPLSLLRECYRIIKPGGTIVISTPNIESNGSEKFQSSWLSLDPPRHLYLFSMKTLKQIAEKAGFFNSSIRTTTRGAESIWYSSQQIKMTGRGQVNMKMGLISKIKAKWFQLSEAISLTQSPKAGEEIVLIAKK